MSTTYAKARLSALAAEVANRGQRVVIERRGEPLAALVSLGDLERLEADGPTSQRPQGALALAGAWREVDDEVMESFIQLIYAQREIGSCREVNLEV